jgi:2-iminobutanoate/2-iminopropanoate deaminase
MPAVQQDRQGGLSAVGKLAVASPKAPKAIGPYSAAVRAGQLLFVSGQVPLDPDTGAMVDGDIGMQTRQVLQNISALLEAAGLTISQVARTTVFLADMNDFAAMNEVYRGFFSEPYPARSTIQAARLPRDARIEIDVIASYDA